VFVPIIPQNSIYMATLGKAAGTMGAFVAGDEDLIDFHLVTKLTNSANTLFIRKNLNCTSVGVWSHVHFEVWRQLR
jgi:7-keto-8-aminopelargonate synthetase-like enzyme